MRSVSFSSSVMVHPIPMRSDYSSRMRKHLWINRHERLKNALRNAIEFEVENHDWRQALEDKDFIYCAYLGEKIHPVHSACYHAALHQKMINSFNRPKDFFVQMYQRDT